MVGLLRRKVLEQPTSFCHDMEPETEHGESPARQKTPPLLSAPSRVRHGFRFPNWARRHPISGLFWLKLTSIASK